MPLQCGTQWDALGHVFNEGKMWNGYPAELVGSGGALLDLSTEITAAVREYRPTAKTVRNLFAPVVLDASLAQEHFAQDYAAFLRRYDYVAVMAMPYLEQARDPRRFYERLAVAALRVDPGAERTIFELQTVDWREQKPLPAREIRETAPK